MIRILDNNTINKIAAGEVIEKPYNVVKELVENSIDSKAKHISVEIKGGGIDYIRVTDDGCGIPYEEVPTAFLRHATSKIVSSEDLFFLNSLGFRGEALASIASVSHTTMITKVEDELMGTKIDLDCGSVIELIKTGSPNGTTIIIRDLFFNVPARKKFLNSASAEATKITELMEELVLSNPYVSFQLIVNGQVKIQTNGSGNLKDVIFRLYGKEIHDALLPVEYEDEFIKITGFITKPEACRPSRSGENYFINGRYVKNDYITRGIEEGYRNFLMQHKFPFVVLFVELDPFGLDVNVHPAKSEVRITNGEFLVEILNKTIHNALTDNELIPNAFNFKEEEKKLERAPEPFETKLIKNSYVVQKGYDAQRGVSLNSDKDSDTEPNDKSKEFEIDFDNKKEIPADSRPNNEFMNHITTISYKSKYDKMEERMRNDVDDENDESDNDKNIVNNESADNEINKDENVNNESVDNEINKDENVNNAAVDNEMMKDNNGSALMKNRVENAPVYGLSDVNDNSDPDLSLNDIKGSALLKTRLNKETIDNNADESISGSALYKNRIVQSADNVSANDDKDTLSEKSVDDTHIDNDPSEETPDDQTSVNPFEEWLNSIENKDTVEIEKEASGMIVKINPDEIKNADDEGSDSFYDFEDELKKVTKQANTVSDAERLSNADKKYSVLNDDINPINTVEPEEKISTFRVKDFDKDIDDTPLTKKENVDNIFKKADRFHSATKHEPKSKETQSVLFNEKTLDPSKLSKFKIIDQIFDTYWLILVENELLIMDQHAAHEKVLYEKFMDKFNNNKIETQTLMLSQVVNLSKSEMDVYLRYKNEFERFGFIINDFGDKDLFIRGIPTDLFGSDAKSLFLDILSELINVSPSMHIDIIESRIATRACKAAIKGNQKISKEDCHKLLEYMLTLKNPYQCPHGRPTLIRISQTDLEKMFKRIVS